MAPNPASPARTQRGPDSAPSVAEKVAKKVAEEAATKAATKAEEAATKAAKKEPDVEGLMKRIGGALAAHQRSYRRKRGEGGSMESCEHGFSDVYDAHYLPGCPSESGCKAARTLGEAKRLCLTVDSCGGVTLMDGLFQLRASPDPMPSGAGERSWVRKSCLHERSTAEAVWHTFRQAMDAALADPSLNLRDDLYSPREDDSFFIAISAYRDDSCRWSLRRAFERADHPEKVSVGIIQQNCDKNCLVAEGWGETRRLYPGPPDPDCAEEFCASELGRPHCDAGRVRILRLLEADALGPLFSRYLNAKLWRGETFYLQIDAHTNFRRGWDTELADALKQTASYPRSVISNYPIAGDPRDDTDWGRAAESELSTSALCGCTFEDVADDNKHPRLTIRLKQVYELSTYPSTATPRYSAFVAAGFFVTHSSFLLAVPPDPFMPFVFMGEEISITMRMWTSGFDIYAPRRDVLGHEYVRSRGVKFWESVDTVYSRFGMNNMLTAIIIQRMQHLLDYPEARKPSQVNPPDLLTRMDEFGAGKQRTLADFLETMQLDLVRKRQSVPQWCSVGEAPARAIRKKPTLDRA